MITVGEASQMITALAAVGGLVVSFLNRRKIEVVRKATDGLVEKLGQAREAKGHADGLQQASDEESLK